MSIRLIAGVGMLVVMSTAPLQAAHAQRRGHDRRDVVECKSENYELNRCRVPWRDARIVRQMSNTPCRRGQNWGIDRRGIWVNAGCSARFAEAGGRDRRDRDGDEWRPPSGWNRRFRVSCESHNYEYQFCAVDLGRAGRAHLERQTSGSPCRKGRTWGWNRAGIWVTQGCAGVFMIDRRWR